MVLPLFVFLKHSAPQNNLYAMRYALFAMRDVGLVRSNRMIFDI